MIALGSVARIIAPQFAAKSLEMGIIYCFGSTALLSLISGGIMLVFWKSNGPYEREKSKSE